MSTFFIPGRARCALSGIALGSRAEAGLLPAVALLPGVSAIALRHFAQPASRWVGRESWAAFEHRDRWVAAAEQAWARHGTEGPTEVTHAREGIVVTRSAERWFINDLHVLASVDFGGNEVDEVRSQLRGLRDGAPQGDIRSVAYDHHFERRGDDLRLEVSQQEECFDVIDLSPTRLQAWLAAIPAQGPVVADIDLGDGERGCHRLRVRCDAVERVDTAIRTLRAALASFGRFDSSGAPLRCLGGRVVDDGLELWLAGDLRVCRALQRLAGVTPLKQLANVLGGTVAMSVDSASFHGPSEARALPFTHTVSGRTTRIAARNADGPPPVEALTVLAELFNGYFHSLSPAPPACPAWVEGEDVRLPRPVDWDMAVEQISAWMQLCWQPLAHVDLSGPRVA